MRVTQPHPDELADLPRVNPSGPSLVAKVLGTALAYAVVGVLGIMLALPPGYVSPFFPAAGLAVALVLCYGTPVLPGVYLGSVALNLAVGWQHGNLDGRAALVALGLGLGATLQAGFAGAAVTRAVGSRWRRLVTERDIIWMLVVAGPLACLISPSVGHAILLPSGIVALPDALVSWGNWWLGDTLGVVIFAPMILIVSLRSASPWKERVLAVLVPMVVTLVLVAAIFVGASRSEDRRIRDHIADQGQKVVQRLERRLVAHQEALTSLKRLLEVMPDMGFHEFEYFTHNTVKDNRDIFALSYNPCVRPETRARVERFFAENGPKADYRITERDANKHLVPAGERPLYVSVGFIAPLEGNQPAIGFDIYSEPLRHDAIDRAMRAGAIAVTAPLRLVQENQPRVGVLVLVPAYRQETSLNGDVAGSLFAFAVGVFKVDEMVRLAVGPLLTPSLVLRITDPVAAAEQRTLFASDGDGTEPVQAYAWSTSIAMADRSWSVELIPTMDCLRSKRSWLGLAVGIVGLLFATLLQVMLLAMTGRTAVIRQTVAEQTVALKAAKDVAEASQSRLLSLTGAAMDAILMMDPQGKVAFWNPAAERILGYTPQEAVGQDLHAFLAPERFHGAFHANFPAFKRTGQGNAVGQTVELCARSKDGREVPISLSLSSVMIDQVWHAVGILRDISDLKKHEADLLEAKDAAEAATVAKSRFLANMSHEIRTPMNGIIGMTSLLLETELSEEQRVYAGIVRSSSDSLLNLVNEILDFSKLEASKLSLEAIEFGLADLLDDVCAAMASRACELDLELVCDAAPAIPACLRGDPSRLRQVLSNLLGNALKFTHEGAVIVRARVVEDGADDVVVRIAVVDTGIGIPVEGLDLLFQKFSQVDASTTRQYGGTGLGLAISKELVELMGGEIGVTSESGRGSEFWFTVRLGRVPPSDESGSAGPPRGPSVAGLKNVRILVVDDSPESREVLVGQLADLGLRPLGVSDGSAALKTMLDAEDDGDRVSLALVDARMAGMSGEALGRAIRANPRLASVRMAIMVCMGERGDSAHFRELGFGATLLKPIRRHELRGALLQLASAPSGSVPSATPGPVAPVGELPPAPSGRGRVLIVEDNRTNQLVALGALKRLGVSAEAVDNGAEALAILAAQRFHLVFMDVQMPEMDGYEATRRIRSREGLTLDPTVPIVAMTAHATLEDRERCLAAGMDDYLSKPVNRQALAAILERWLPSEPPVASPEQ